MKNQKKKRSLVGKFFLTFLLILLVYCIAFGGYIAYTYLNDDADDDFFKEVETSIAEIIKLPEKTNVLLLGVDADLTRTDTIMIASYDSTEKKLSLVSVPRDTRVVIPPDRWEVMCQNIPQLDPYGSRQIKVNAIHNYGGEQGVEFLSRQLQEDLGIMIDYYVKIDCDGFAYIVDQIGGVEFDVPMKMDYDDPTPGKELHIHLQPGLQTLTGDQAVQLVRYRKGYDNQDLGRAETQQEFMRVLISAIVKKENILSNPTAYLNAVIKYVETDMNITQMLKYVPEMPSISGSNITGYTLPGEARFIGDVSYYILDDDLTKDMVDQIFFNSPAESEEESSSPENSLGKKICVLNGGYTSGLAGKKRDMLEREGYSISYIGDYDGLKVGYTRIYVSEEGEGEDLAEYFDNPEIIADSSKTYDCDIAIVLGTREE